MSESQKITQPSHEQLVQELHEPWSRRRARQRLVAAGAVGPLLECLGSTNESVVWAAIRSLGEMRATTAVGPLVDLLERGTLVLDVSTALKMVTGQDFGADVRKWRQWLQSHGDTVPAKLDVAACIQRTGHLLGAEPSGGENSFYFRLSQPDGRTQKVGVFFGREDADGEELVVVYSQCGPANPKYFEAVLRKNLSIPDGAFAIRDVGDQPHFVIVDTILAALVTPTALARKIENIAARADLVEKALAEEDKN